MKDESIRRYWIDLDVEGGSSGDFPTGRRAFIRAWKEKGRLSVEIRSLPELKAAVATLKQELDSLLEKGEELF